MAASNRPSPAGHVAFTYPAFSLYIAARFFMVVALEMQSVAVGWQVYEITRKPLDLGLVGLAQFLPGILLFLVSGHAADRFDRRTVLLSTYVGFALCSCLLLECSIRGIRSIALIYGIMVLVGVVRSFSAPSSRAILPQLVREEHFPNAVAWNGSIFQGATILGPSVGGFIYALSRGPSAVYGTAVAAAGVAIYLMLRVKLVPAFRVREPLRVKTVLAGLDYIWRQKLILGSISLDLFAVLLGGAVALLPFYASEILKTGPWGLGLLRSAPGIGAASMALLLAYRPLNRRAGATMLWCVAGFGFFTILFGLSRSLFLSMVSLLFVGATDMVSVVVRGTLVQIATPDEMRGRVTAVDMIFIGASNEFGQFESGLTAHWFGTVPAVVLGGIGSLIVTGLWAWGFPELRNADKLTLTGN
jgi:MFS family permease